RHIANLEKERKDRESELRGLKKERKEREVHVKNLEKERRERERHIGDLEKERVSILSELRSFRKERDERERHIANLEKDRKEREVHIRDLEKERKAIRFELEAFRKDRRERKKQVAHLENAQDLLRAEVESLTRDRDILQKAFSESKRERGRLNVAVISLWEELSAAHGEVSDALARVAMLEGIVEEESGERERLNRHIFDLQKAQEADRAELLRLQGLIAERSGELDHFRGENESLKRELESERRRFQRLLKSREWKLTRPLRWIFRVVRKLRAGVGMRLYPLSWEYRAIRKSGLFDAAYYTGQIHNMGKLNPLAHYVKHGAKEGKRPHPLFDPAYYLAQNPDVAELKPNPLAHFVKYGVREGRDPNPFFSVEYYLAQAPEAAGMNPVAHYLEVGAARGMSPSPLFDSNSYLACNPDVAVAGMNPLVHFVLHGAEEGRNPRPEPGSATNSTKDCTSSNPVEEIVYCLESEDTWKDATVSVIVPTLNAADDFVTFLPAFKSQKGLQHVEIVVVDSGSTDNTVELAEKFGARIIKIPQKEFSHSHARNLGAEHASGNYFLFITQDALPPSESWLHEMLSAIKKSEAAAVSCAEFPREDVDLFYRISSWHHHRTMDFDRVDRLLSMPDVQDYLELRKNAQLSDTACLIVGDLFKKYRFRNDYAEDLDLGLRLIRDGHKLAFLCSTKIIHSHNRPPFYYLKRAYVDNLTMGKIFPDLEAPRVGIDGFARDILYTYEILNSLVRKDLCGMSMPCDIETFVTTVKAKLCSTHFCGGLAREDVSNNSYTDEDFKAFVGKILSLYPAEKGVRYDGILVHAIIAFVEIAVDYMGLAYEKIDSTILGDFNASLYKALAYQAGAHLCFCRWSSPETKTREMSKIVSELTQGI
ncbi:MAG: glycosyltransferase, partial [Deltaproteobacteria bacterium]|nr:glycosyltransferase [Deltaproteobacteria bacterium]